MLAEGGGLEPRCASLLLAQPGRGRTTTSLGGGRPPDAHRDTPGKEGGCGAGVTRTEGCTAQGLSVSHSSGVGNRKRRTGAASHAGSVGLLSPPGLAPALSFLAPAV